MLQQTTGWREAYLDRYYRSRPGWQDGTAEFHALIRKHMPQPDRALELGPGPANATSLFLSRWCPMLEGLDIDEGARANPFLARVHIYDGNGWPLPDGEYDAVVADYVLEHLPRPAQTIAEVFRVLRPGGCFFFRTPNLWHYVSVTGWLSPHWFHRLVANRLRNLPQGHHDPYPTYYRLNTRRSITTAFLSASFEGGELYTIEKEPSYGLYARPLFLLLMGYERLVNASNALAGLRANILGMFRKPGIPQVGQP